MKFGILTFKSGLYSMRHNTGGKAC